MLEARPSSEYVLCRAITVRQVSRFSERDPSNRYEPDMHSGNHVEAGNCESPSFAHAINFAVPSLRLFFTTTGGRFIVEITSFHASSVMNQHEESPGSAWFYPDPTGRLSSCGMAIQRFSFHSVTTWVR